MRKEKGDHIAGIETSINDMLKKQEAFIKEYVRKDDLEKMLGNQKENFEKNMNFQMDVLKDMKADNTRMATKMDSFMMMIMQKIGGTLAMPGTTTPPAGGA